MTIDPEKLKRLYGTRAAGALLPRLHELIERHRPRIPAAWRTTPRHPLPLTEQSSLLITYGDQVQRPGQPPLETLREFLRRNVSGRVNGVHLLPFYPYSSDDGFSVVDYRAVNPDLGDWRDIRNLAADFELMFDGVFNHVSARSEWFQRFQADDPEYREFFIVVEGRPDLRQVVRPRTLPLLTSFRTPGGEKRVWTTFSADQVDLNFANPEVLLAVLDTLLFYVTQGARFLRLDAIAYLWKEPGTPCIHLPQTHAIIQLMRELLDALAPGVMLITETNVPHRENISYFGDGHNEAQLVYNFALPPLTLHAFAREDATALSQWAEGLISPSPDTTFFNFLASHDGIGVSPARGILPEREVEHLAERVVRQGGYVSCKSNPDGSESPYELNITWFDALSDPSAAEPVGRQVDRFIASQALMLALAGMPGIYFHSLFGSRNDRAGAESSGIPRRINRRKLDGDALEAELLAVDSVRSRVFERYSMLLEARRSQPAFHPLAPQRILHLDPRLFALERGETRSGNALLCLHNISSQQVRVRLNERHKACRNLLTGNRHEPGPDGLELRLQPYEVWWGGEAAPRG